MFIIIVSMVQVGSSSSCCIWFFSFLSFYNDAWCMRPGVRASVRVFLSWLAGYSFCWVLTIKAQ